MDPLNNTSKKVSWLGGLLALGVILRFKPYLENRSLWLDEAWLSLSVSAQSFRQMFFLKPFSNDLPRPPTGFLFLEKFSTEFLGNNELTLRLIPFFAGVASLYLLCSFLKRYSSKESIYVGIGLLALSQHHIYYSSEVKQYTLECFLTLALLVVADVIRKGSLSLSKVVMFGMLGAIAVYCSHPSVFVLAPIAGVLLYQSVAKKDWNRTWGLIGSFSFWAFVAIVLYFYSIRYMVGTKEFFEGNRYLPPAAFFTFENFQWTAQRALKIFENPVGIEPGFFGAALFLIGAGVVYKKDKQTLFLLMCPIVLSVLATMLRKYPIGERFAFFALPMLLLFISEGAMFLWGKLKKFHISLACFLIVVLFAAPIKNVTAEIISPKPREEIRPLVQHLRFNFLPGDALYMNNSAQYGFGYYHGYFRFYDEVQLIGSFYEPGIFEEDPPVYIKYVYLKYDSRGYTEGYINTENNKKHLERDFKSFKNNKRTWVLLSHIQPPFKKNILKQLDLRGERIKEITVSESSLYLYDLSR